MVATVPGKIEPHAHVHQLHIDLYQRDSWKRDVLPGNGEEGEIGCGAKVSARSAPVLGTTKSSWPPCSTTNRERMSIRVGNEAAMMKPRTNGDVHPSEQERSATVVGVPRIRSADIEAFRPLCGDIERVSKSTKEKMTRRRSGRCWRG